MDTVEFSSNFGFSGQRTNVSVGPVAATISAEFNTANASDKLSLTDDGTLNFVGLDFSICGWFKAIETELTRILISYGTGDSAADFAYYISTPGEVLVRFVVSDGTLTAQANSNLITLGTDWHFFAVTYDAGSRILSCSLDNGTPGTGEAVADISDFVTGSTLQVGRADGWTSVESDQKMCCVGIFDSVLSAGQIEALYNSGNAVVWDGLSTELQNAAVAYWNLDEESAGSMAVTRADSTSNALDLTDAGTTTSSEDAP